MRRRDTSSRKCSASSEISESTRYQLIHLSQDRQDGELIESSLVRRKPLELLTEHLSPRINGHSRGSHSYYTPIPAAFRLVSIPK